MTHGLEAINREIAGLTKELMVLQGGIDGTCSGDVFIRTYGSTEHPFSNKVELTTDDRKMLTSNEKNPDEFIKVNATLSETKHGGFHDLRNILVTIGGTTWSATVSIEKSHEYGDWRDFFRNHSAFFLKFTVGDLYLYKMEPSYNSLIRFEKPPRISTLEHSFYGLLHISPTDTTAFNDIRPLSETNKNNLTKNGHTLAEFIETLVSTRHVEKAKSFSTSLEFNSLVLVVNGKTMRATSNGARWAAAWQDFYDGSGSCYLDCANGTYTLRNIESGYAYLTFS